MRRSGMLLLIVGGILVSPSLVSAQDEDCGTCGDVIQCILGCEISNPTSCGPCWDGNSTTPCMFQGGGCSFAIRASDGELYLPPLLDEALSIRLVATVEGDELLIRSCDGAILRRQEVLRLAQPESRAGRISI